jgi:hypothetical protein
VGVEEWRRTTLSIAAIPPSSIYAYDDADDDPHIKILPPDLRTILRAKKQSYL